MGKYTTASAGISASAGGGVLIAPDGVYAYGDTALGLETNVSISSEIGVTFFPTMPSAKYAAGKGTSAGVNFNVGFIANGTGSVNYVESSGYKGVSTTFGVGAGLPGVFASASVYDTNTTLKPLSELANKTVALDALNTAQGKLSGMSSKIASERNTLLNSQNYLRNENRSISSQLGSATGNDRSSLLSQLKGNLDALNSSQNRLDQLDKSFNEVNSQLNQVNQAIDEIQ